MIEDSSMIFEIIFFFSNCYNLKPSTGRPYLNIRTILFSINTVLFKFMDYQMLI